MVIAITRAASSHFNELMTELVKSDGMTMLIVTHEMGFARDVADRVVIMDEGQLIEQGKPNDIFNNPQHKQTQALLDRPLPQQSSIEMITKRPAENAGRWLI